MPDSIYQNALLIFLSHLFIVDLQYFSLNSLPNDKI